MRIYCDDYQDMHDFNDLMDDLELVLESNLAREKDQDNVDTRAVVELEEMLRKYRNVKSAIEKVVVRD